MHSRRSPMPMRWKSSDSDIASFCESYREKIASDIEKYTEIIEDLP